MTEDGTAMQLDGGVWDVYDFDPVDQLTQVKYSASSSSGTLPQRTVGYDWDPVGNRTQVQSIETNGPVSTDTYATATAVNQYPSVNGSPLGYDANGNLTSAAVGGVFDPASPSTALAYDSQNRLTSITATPGGGGSPTLSLTQVHDSRNRVIARTISGVTTLFVWDDWDLIEERDLSGALLRRYVHGAAIDEILMTVDANGARYHHHDALGSVTALTDETGAVVESYTYDVFGQPTVFDSSFNLLPSSLANNRFLYTGREYIAEAGLYDYRNRHYSPQLGRFLQTDPIRFHAGDVNLFRYVGNSVLVWVDPSGLVDLNLTSTNDKSHRDFGRIPKADKTGVFTVAGHSHEGSPEWPPSIKDDRKSQPLAGESLTPKELADAIKDGGWDGKTPVELLGCETGKGGEHSLASQLARELGVPVGGCTECVWPGSPNLQVRPELPGGRMDRDNAGGVQWFNPDGTARGQPAKGMYGTLVVAPPR